MLCSSAGNPATAGPPPGAAAAIMQRPAEMEWYTPKCIGDVPNKRSGHTFTIVKGGIGYVFGGLDPKKPPGPNNELYKLDMSNSQEFYWSKVQQGTKCPEARWKHSALLIDETRILVFGGFKNNSMRFNDVWLLDTVKDKWWQPPPGQTELDAEGYTVFKKKWANVPSPRGAHALALVGRKLFVFGGYGGDGYARRDFNDLYALDLDVWEWEMIDVPGELPEARSGHTLVSIGDKLYMCGGWNAMRQFDDLWAFDTHNRIWAKIEGASGDKWGPPRWYHTAVAVFAVPFWKMFVFGGNSGDLNDANSPQGSYLSDLCVYETGQQMWSQPNVAGKVPQARSDTQMVYDSENGLMILFGGWANRWFGDICVCKVADVVGPPYSIESIAPASGPITGNSRCTIKGMGFKFSAGGNASVRFACPKGFLEAPGNVVDDSTMIFDTPNFEKFGPVEVEGRLAIAGKSLTNSVVRFSYFSVANANTTVAFGPGVLSGSAATVPTVFVIQARDNASANRVCGMDEFEVVVRLVRGKGEEDLPDEVLPVKIADQDDGTYIVTYTAPRAGKWKVEVNFLGTFHGVGGPIRGSPFVVTAVDPVEGKVNNNIEGGVLTSYVKDSTTELKDYCNKTLNGLRANIPKDEVEPLIKVKEHLKGVDRRKAELDLRIDANKAALQYLKRKGYKVDRIDHMISAIDTTAGLWQDTIKQAPVTAQTIVPNNKVWAAKIQENIEAYEAELANKVNDFRKLDFWAYDTGPGAAREKMKEAEAKLNEERKHCEKNSHLCSIFEFPEAIKKSTEMIGAMELELQEMRRLWDVAEGLQVFIAESRGLLWREVVPDQLDEDIKGHVKNVKALHKSTRWCDAFKATDKLAKDFTNTIPLISALGSKAMRPRHWGLLMKATKKEFVPPYEDLNLRLGGLLSLNLHEFSNDVEEICDQAVKEEKIENYLKVLDDRWAVIEWGMDMYKDTDVTLLKVAEEDYEALENDLLAVQGHMASRYIGQFQDEMAGWQRALGTVIEIYIMLQDIQRTWSYLEPLFIGSEEVKRELPVDAVRFAGIDVDVKKVLRDAWEVKNVRSSCNADGLLKHLEKIGQQLDLCKKSLADFLDGRRRQFPRYYFTSEADLLDILSNGSIPKKVLVHTSKIYLQTKTLVLSDDLSPTGRPLATRFISDVGVEEVDFEPAVPLEGKVEIYMQTVLDSMKMTLFLNLKRSVVRYREMNRSEWLMHKDKKTGRPSDPAQIILLTVAVNYVQEVEEAFAKMGKGNAKAMDEQYERQIEQLSDLIRLTQSNITKGDRQRVMVCITMDAHSRDIVEKLCREKVGEVTCFQWQAQLKHKYRNPPAHASFRGRDPQLRGERGERAEIAIADAILPYDYEYLGNGPRLVITPLTDRIYVTATQALNMKMGCAPAGPAGTGKTETTKDLANALAKCCYVFNCSPEMDYMGLGNIFKGLASSGAWGCFDEFNRLVPEVLSVCSVQFKAVCDGIKAESARITIEGDEVRLDPTCGAYITMNPGYLGRSELPEGLKALFRPMTVMVPDLVLICENMLMAEGFVTAKVLASKFYGLYSLLRELLSKQMHYDWGLRAVKSVLVVAGSFKRAEPDLAEDALLMRALRDFNIPKIVQEDEVVFFGLLGDLFPNINPPRKQDPELETAVEEACLALKNWPDETFRLKVVQLEELLAIRHCVFVMGPPASGKSQCWKTLAQARKIRNNPTKVVDLNPKAVKTEELYGFISMATREWKDGLLSKVMRELGQIPNENPKWILLDGDLDANWIESMNSVMDDNRMLTLASNERIPLKAYMRMIFEIRDLKYATPATVSRAGILYISTDAGSQWRSLIRSWLQALPEANPACGPTVVAKLQECFDAYCDKTLFWMAVNVKPVLPIVDMNMIQALLYMLDGCLNAKNTATPDDAEVVFVYCAIWAFGSALTVSDDGTDYKKLFSDWWRGEWKKIKFPSRDTVFDYYLDPETNVFDQWTKSPYFYTVAYDSKTTPMTQVTVPTPETCSISFWMQLLVTMRRPVMMAGPAGTGKTQMVFGMLSKQDPAQVVSATINYNFYTTSAVLFNTMSLPLEKKVGTQFGPPGNTRMIYFVDDINLPEVDPYNTQSAIALLRQHMEYAHVYDMSKLLLKQIMNTQVVSCMNPTAGSFLVNPRLQRWFVTFAIGLPGPTSLIIIYQTFLDGHLQYFDQEIKSQSSNIIKAAYGLHQMVASTFRKTAANFHYEFNIRHLSNVFQGLLVSGPDEFKTAEKFVQLWLHESERVYGDRLVSPEDLQKYNALAQSQAKKLFPQFNMTKFYASEKADPLVFCHFTENIQDRKYDQVMQMDRMSAILEDALREYNETNATMDLVLFEDAMKHVARIVRIVLNEGGHALLVGVGGSGKQSLSRLASFICSYTVKQIVISSNYGINDLKEDLKWMYNKAGIKEEGIMFLLTDSQITNERFLIFLNDLLASGNIPDLFAQDEQDNIINACASKVKALGIVPERKSCWDYFLTKIRQNLHVVLAFSPVGDDFRNRARKFPAIVNCTVIDWFQPWPKDALFSVGRKFLADLDLNSTGIRAGIEKFLPYSFDIVNTMAAKFKRVERRFVYTTPKSFLELLKLYGVLLNMKRNEADAAIDRLANGLLKLKETGEAVTKIEEDLKIKLDEAEKKRTIAEAIAENVAREKAVVEVETEKARIESEEVAKIQAEVSVKQRDTEDDLAKAEPAVIKAMAALDTLNKNDLVQCKTMNTPPFGVNDVFAATMVLLAGLHDGVQIQKNGKVKDTGWDQVKKQLLGNIPEYLDQLKTVKEKVDNDTVPTLNWKEIRKYLALEHFQPEIIMTKNSAAAGLCSFVINIVNYYDIVITVEPKRQALREANEQLSSANTRLAAVLATVAELQAKLDKLNKEFDAATIEKQDALDSVARGEKKLNLAQRLTTALSSENERWGINIKQFTADKDLLTGDVLLASAFISYVGPFTKPFRDELMVKFGNFLRDQFRTAVGEGGALPMSLECDPIKVMTTDAQIAEWNTDGLPADTVSTENGAIVCNSARWPLMIDPQLQGIRWIRTKEKARNLAVVRLGQAELLRKLSAALENGWSVLIENLGESIDAVLGPVIQRAGIKRGKKFILKIGDAEVEFHPMFRLFLHTKLSNPHYPPEIQAETTLVNFTVTEKGLEDQILALVVRKERRDLAELGEQLVTQQNGFKIKMKELEDNILFKLATAQGDITEDVELIEGLEETKRIATDIGQKAELARITQANIKITSEKYRPVANRSSLLFFLMNDLVKIHTYYIYSLAAFTLVFYRGIDLASVAAKKAVEGEEGQKAAEEEEKRELNDEELGRRCNVLIDSITKTVFNYVRRGVFERDKLTVSTLLVLKIMVNDGHLSQEEVDFLVMGKMVADPGNMGPLQEWMPAALWPKVKALDQGLKRFNNLGDNMQSDTDEWLKWFDNEQPEVAKLPGDYEKNLNDFERLILLRALRPDRITTALRTWIGRTMGPDYIFQKPFDMAATFEETGNNTPMFFVLFPGVDPTPWVEGLGKTMGISSDNNTFINISMGQGQEKPAEAWVERFAKEGGWVMLQNCHLMQSWVPKLERLLEVVGEKAHPNFRCFISAEPPPIAAMKNMPESLMQGSIKVANEAPADIKSNMIRAWANFSQERVETCTKPSEFKACLFSLCWFHSIVLGRKRFGQQGWSRAYSFNTGDLTICANVLQAYLDANPVVPWDDLRYIFGEIMYGGHITDPWDRRTCNTYLTVLLRQGLFEKMELGPNFRSPNPEELTYDGYLEYIGRELPPESPPQFGLHPNAEIGYLTNSALALFNTILSISGAAADGGGGGGTGANPVKQIMTDLSERLPPDFIMLIMMEKAKPLLLQKSGPFVVVALQECARMNALLGEIRRSLGELDKGLKGQLNMSQAMEDLSKAFILNEWPGRNPFSQCAWEKLAWPSKKSLISEFMDVLNRIAQLIRWTEDLVTPVCLWLPGLFNPTAYLTAVMQVTARQTGLPLDKMTIETHMSTMLSADQPKDFPVDGAFVHGLFIEGARWPTGEEVTETYLVGSTVVGGHLCDSKLKELLPRLPVVYVKAVPVQPTWEPSAVGYLRHQDDLYEAPVYITSFRGPTYVFLATLKSADPTSKWVLTGTAVLMQTDD